MKVKKILASAFAAVLLVFICAVAHGQNTLGKSDGLKGRGLVSELSKLRKKANDAHQAGRFNQEIEVRQQISDITWAAFTRNPKLVDEYERYDVVLFNDLPLGLLLEGMHRLRESETVFRHNRAELAKERVAGNDIKSENELQLAHLLAIEGNAQEAKRICSHWKGRMRRLAAGQDSAHIYGIPKSPLRDTPEAETALWELSCGDSMQGLKLIEGQISAHPQMLIAYTILSSYYYAQGDFQKAQKIESDGDAAVTGR
ncbi:MAG TPA: hypothetical protein VFU55_09540 [Terracidiphilus sp.]|nr:hypothetical protein [Terracidiphilus sp.]